MKRARQTKIATLTRHAPSGDEARFNLRVVTGLGGQDVETFRYLCLMQAPMTLTTI